MPSSQQMSSLLFCICNRATKPPLRFCQGRRRQARPGLLLKRRFLITMLSFLDFLRHCRRFSFHERDFRSSLLRLRKSSLFVSSSLSVPNQIFSSFLPVGSQLLHYTLQGEFSTASTATSAASWGSFNAASTF